MLPIETDGPNNVSELLVSLTQNFKVTLSCLSKLTNLDVELLEKIISKQIDLIESGLSVEQLTKLVSTANKFTQVVPAVEDNERLKAIIEHLTQELEIGFETISIYTQISVEDLESFMKDPNSISYEKRYRLGVKSIFLQFLFK